MNSSIRISVTPGLLCLLALLFPVTTACAATRTWDGSSSGAWGAGANWVGNVAPTNGDDLVFPANAARFTITNDIANLNPGSITLSGSNYFLRGNVITLSSGITANYSNGTSTVDFPMRLGAAQTFMCTNAGSFLIISSGLTNQAHLLTTDGSGTITFSATAAISGAGGLTKNGSGAVFLEASNSFSGVVTITGGNLQITDSSALGNTNAGTMVQGTGLLILESGVHVGLRPLTLNAPSSGPRASLASVSGGGSNSWAGPVLIETNTVINAPSGTTINLAGTISGPGSLTSIGAGTLVFSGLSANTYTSVTRVNAGTLVLNKSGFAASIIGPLYIGDGVGGANSDVVNVQGDLQIGQNSDVTITNSGELNISVSNHNQYIGSLAGSGNVSLAPTTDFETGFDNTSTVFSGVISGSSGLHKVGNGTMTLSGSNTYTGTTSVSGGALIINGFQPQSPVSISSATLDGTGTVGNISALGGAISPGASPGILTCSNVDFGSSFTKFVVELNGPSPGTGYDQLAVRGSNNLHGATLDISIGGGLIPTPGQTFTILRNDGGFPLTGTFGGLPEGTVTNVNGVSLAISYVGGSGHDVVLTQVSGLPALTVKLTATNTVLISWPSPFTGFVLQQNTGLGTTNWVTPSETVNDNGTNRFIIVNPPSGNRFYRLKQ